uniref:Uncharacterized protein n=1 Tax=Strombidinopsis acuminata TaxID=141414 RepID=A0A7S3TLE2_9SPIT|mmetsp:Transcript_69534/g.96534  ORF Transcript_69534/g.96534 Transcript_69534/m.96534 type:complete len:105 (+) Transcript_69534:77-391(+)
MCPIFPYWDESYAYENAFDAIVDVFVDPIYEIADEVNDLGLEFVRDSYYDLNLNQVVEEPADEGFGAWTYGIAAVSGIAAIATMAAIAIGNKKSGIDSDYERIL